MLTKGQSERFLAHVNFTARVLALSAEAFMNDCSSYEPSARQNKSDQGLVPSWMQELVLLTTKCGIGVTVS